MKRYLYVLIVAAVTGSPVTLAAEPPGEDDDSLLIDGSDTGRGGARHSPTRNGTVLVRVLADDAPAPTAALEQIGIAGPANLAAFVPAVPIPEWAAAGGVLVVDASAPHTAKLHTLGRESSASPGATAELIARALDDAWARGDLKVIIDSPLDLPRLCEVCISNRFRYSRSITRGGRELHEFIADLYTSPKRGTIAQVALSEHDHR